MTSLPPAGKMHADEIVIDPRQVQSLVASQFPQWRRLPVVPVTSSGTDNAIFRLGEDLAIRMPRIPSATGQVEKECRWLPQLAPHLPLAIPVPLAKGDPDGDYPWPWSIYRWLDGQNATLTRLSDPVRSAQTLAEFVLALQMIDGTDGPLPGPANSFRGAPLATRDAATRKAILDLKGTIDTTAALRLWDNALTISPWDRLPVWLHGDLQSGNLLCVNGQLSAVIDFGCLGTGDPACDLIVAWNLFPAEARHRFRTTLAVDEDTWARGRGWALSTALIALPYYATTNPALAEIARFTIDAVLTEDAHDG